VGRFPPPSKVVANLDARWDVLIERCLAVEPSGRPHSALELAHALETLGGVERQMALAPRTKRKAGKSGIWSWLGIGTAVAVVLGVVSLRVAQDHGARRPSAPAARAAPKRPVHVR
jgi:hypothetical protein